MLTKIGIYDLSSADKLFNIHEAKLEPYQNLKNHSKQYIAALIQTLQDLGGLFDPYTCRTAFTKDNLFATLMRRESEGDIEDNTINNLRALMKNVTDTYIIDFIDDLSSFISKIKEIQFFDILISRLNNTDKLSDKLYKEDRPFGIRWPYLIPMIRNCQETSYRKMLLHLFNSIVYIGFVLTT